jgi:hypothetical protein
MKTKAKKATAGERHVAKWTSQTIHFIRNDENSMIEAAEFDRAIAAAVRKERREILDQIRTLTKANPRSKETLKFIDHLDWVIECRGEAPL